MTRVHKTSERGVPPGKPKSERRRPEDASMPASTDVTRLAETAEGRREAGEPEGPSAEPPAPPVWDDRAG